MIAHWLTINELRQVAGAILLLSLVVWVTRLGTAAVNAQLGTAPAGEPCLAGAALWGNALDHEKAIEVNGRQHTMIGRLHSNQALYLGGRNHLINGMVEYVTDFVDAGNDNHYPEPQQVEPQAMPYQFNIVDFQPAGVIAQEAAARGDYHLVSGDWHVDKHDRLDEGLYYVTGNVDLKREARFEQLTVVAEGRIKLDTEWSNWEPAVAGLLFFSSQPQSRGQGVEVKGHNSLLQGVLYAPSGTVNLDGTANLHFGSILAERIALNGRELSVVYTKELCGELPPVPTPGDTPTPTASAMPTDTPTLTNTPTPTTPGPTEVPSSTPTPSPTLQPTATSEATATPTPTATATPLPPLIMATKIDYLWQDNDEDNQVSAGDILLYAILVTNQGPTAANAVRIYDAVDLATTLLPGTVESEQGTVIAGNTAGDTEAVVDLASLAPGASVNLRLRVQVKAYSALRHLSNQAVITYRHDDTGGAGSLLVRSDDPDTAAVGDATVTPLKATQAPLFLPLVSSRVE